MLRDALVIGALILAGGGLIGAQVAVLSLSKGRLSELADAKARGAQAVQALRSDPERLRITVLLTVALMSSAAALGGERVAATWGRRLGDSSPALADHAGGLGLALLVGQLASLGLVVGLVARSLALHWAEPYALAVGPTLRQLTSLVAPGAWALTGTSRLLLRLCGIKSPPHQARLSLEEIQGLIEEAESAGTLDRQSSEIALRAIDFHKLTVVDVMVPRVAMVAIDRRAKADELRTRLVGRRVARLLVHDGSPENIIGYVALRDVLLSSGDTLDLGALMRPVRFVPVTMRAADLLRDMQVQYRPMVLVIDETGSILGLVTIEDLLEEIVGNLLGENDPTPTVLALGPDGSVDVDGTTTIRDINRVFSLELPEPEGFVTIAGLCLYAAQAIPARGASLVLPGGTRVEVLDASNRCVLRVRLWPSLPAPFVGGR